MEAEAPEDQLGGEGDLEVDGQVGGEGQARVAPAVGEDGQPAQPPENIPAQAQNGQAAANAGPAYELTKTIKNKEAVIKDGFTYIRNGSYKQTAYWRCINCGKKDVMCTAGGKSALDSREIVFNGNPHNHDPDAAETKGRQLFVEARERAATMKNVAASAIVDDLLTGVDDDVALAVKRANLLRVAHRARREDGSQMVNRRPAEIEWPPAFKETSTGARFLLYDSRQDAPDEPIIFIWASATQLDKLREQPHWSADGTFWSRPQHFEQLYTLHANIGHSSVPAAYILMENRTEASYIRAFRALIRLGGLFGVSPTSIMHDFEKAAINALHGVFRDSAIRLCLFHFAQALWRNIAERGLKRLYVDNAKARELLRCFGALATLPVRDVIRGLNEIVNALRGLLHTTNEIPLEYEAALADFEDYFERTYVRRLAPPGQRGARFVDPTFKPALWNCHQAILQGLFRTNNASEGKFCTDTTRLGILRQFAGWHYEFNGTCGTGRLAMDKFVNRLKTDEDKNRQRLVRQEHFQAEAIRRNRLDKHVRSDKHMLAIAQKYSTHYEPTGQILRYLRCMQFHLAKARFPGEAGEEEIADEEEGGGDDEDGGGDIPLNESHPGLEEDVPDANEVQAEDLLPPNGMAVLVAAAGLRRQAEANRAEDDLPGFTQAPVAGPSQPYRRQANIAGPSQSNRRQENIAGPTNTDGQVDAGSQAKRRRIAPERLSI